MVSTAQAYDTRHSAHRTDSRGLLATLLTLLKWLVLSLILSILAEWIGMTFFWQDQGLQHSRDMLVNEIGYLSDDFSRSVVTSNTAQFAQSFADTAHQYLFEFTGLVALHHWLTSSRNENNGMQSRLQSVYQPVAQYVVAAMTVTQVFAVRTAVLTLAMPVFVLAALMGITDGLVQRDLRRWGGGRESSFIYHHAKRAIGPVFIVTWVIYLALPFSLHPSWVVLPFALLFGVAVAVSAASFKKYL